MGGLGDALCIDAVAALLERDDDPIDSVHCQSDASPVTGLETQAMLMGICLATGVIMRFVMPGIILMYGGMRYIDKCIAFLWSLYLLVGANTCPQVYSL